MLIQAGCSKILIACNTAHVFLPEIYKKFPLAQNYIVDIIEDCAAHLKNRDVKKVFRMASEGTILSGVYEEGIILGCTELPVLHNKCKAYFGGVNFYGPTIITLEKLQTEFAEF